MLKLFKPSENNEWGCVNDKRTLKRYDLPLKVSYRDPLTRSHGECLTKDISRTGLRMPVSAKLQKGALLDLEIEDPYGHKNVSSKAKVIWSERFVTGDDADDVIYEAGLKLLKKRLWD